MAEDVYVEGVEKWPREEDRLAAIAAWEERRDAGLSQADDIFDDGPQAMHALELLDLMAEHWQEILPFVQKSLPVDGELGRQIDELTIGLHDSWLDSIADDWGDFVNDADGTAQLAAQPIIDWLTFRQEQAGE